MTDAILAPPGAALPTPLTSFIGREGEVEHVRALLVQPDVRLVTLTGPGGVGKTRLALRVAQALQGAFTAGVAFVPLAPITDPELVCSTISQALGVRERSDRSPGEHLADVLRDRQMLLVLDNFEQIVEAAPQLSVLLAACPNLRLLVTSRILLRISGEFDVPVRPLPLPDPTVAITEQVSADAVRLFVERARAADATFHLTADNGRAITAICQRLDGLPLALELVAAKARFLPPHAMLPRLAQTLPLLTGGRRDDPARLQTMRNAIRWSYDLLGPEDQALFQRLAIFTGGFTLEAAEAVASGAGDTEADVLAGVESLLYQSLIHRIEDVTGSGEARFGMLETVREFGLERLAAHALVTETRDRHARYFLQVAEAAEPELIGTHQRRSVAQLGHDMANLRTALAWLREQACAQEALQLAGALTRFWHLIGQYGEGLANLEAGLALPGDVAPAVCAKALTGACQMADWLGNYDYAVPLGDAAVRLWRTLDDSRRLADSLLVLAVALIQVDNARAEAAGLESLELFRALGDQQRMADVLDGLGVAAYARGDYATAAARMETGLPLARQSADPAILGDLLGDLGHVSLVVGDYRRARELIGEALTIHRGSGGSYWIAWCLACLAGVIVGSQPTRAATLFGAAAALREEVSAPLRPSVQAVYAPMLAQTRSLLGDEAFTSAWDHGYALSLEDAIAEGLTVVEEPTIVATPKRQCGDPFGLTPREAEVLQLVAAGQSNGEIAAALFISVPTVKRHVSTILGKLDLTSRAAVVAFAHAHGLN